MRWFCGWLGFNSIETTVSRQHFDKAEKKFNILGHNCFCFAFDFLSLCVMFYLRYYVHIVHVTVCFSSFATALLLCYWYSCHFLLCIPWNWNDDMRSHRIERTKPIRKQWQLLYGSMIYMLLSCICGCQCKRCNHEIYCIYCGIFTFTRTSPRRCDSPSSWFILKYYSSFFFSQKRLALSPDLTDKKKIPNEIWADRSKAQA